MDKKKCMIMYGLREKRNPVKTVRERDEREMVKRIVSFLQDDEQELEREVEEVYRMGKYKEGEKRPLKVKMRSQGAAEELLARTGKLAGSEEYKNIWVKRDMNLEEREREKELRHEAKEKNERRTETEKEEFYWKIVDGKLRKWYNRERKEEAQEIQE